MLELPLRERAVEVSEHVIGSVLGGLRATGTGALRPIALQGPKSRARAKVRENETKMPEAASPGVSPELLERTHEQWREWFERVRDDGRAASGDLERWERLDGSLGALCECVSRTHNPILRAALLHEASGVVSEVTSELRRYSNYPLLQ